MIRLELTGTSARAGRSARAAAAAVGSAAVVTALLAITAIASRDPLNGLGRTGVPSAPPYGRSQINAPVWSLVLVAVGAAIAFSGVVVAIHWEIPRRRRREEEPPRNVIQIPRKAKLVALLIPLLLGAVLVAAAIEGSRARTPIRPGHGSLVSIARRHTPPPGRFTSYHPPTWILPAVLGVLLGGGGAIVLVLASARSRPTSTETTAATEQATALGEAVEASLDDLHSERDPRLAVISAYRRMEATLADAGLARRAWEAPREYSGRARNQLELSARPLQTLTALFERARFGIGRVNEPLREQAIAALLALREELRG